MNVAFVGSGNVASHLAPALDNTDFPVRAVYSRNPAHASLLVDRLYNAAVVETLDLSRSGCDIVILAIPDDAILDVVEVIRIPPGACLIHTSGSQPMDILTAVSPRAGVLYPLQTFTKGKKVDLREVPVFTEGTDREATRLLRSMASAVSKHVYDISSDQRQALHVAAVFASNFTNHMLSLSVDVLTRHKLRFEWLKPLVAETINKAMALGPAASQTGPARRGDLEILDRHFGLLQFDPALAEIYRAISQNIVDRFDEEE